MLTDVSQRKTEYLFLTIRSRQKKYKNIALLTETPRAKQCAAVRARPIYSGRSGHMLSPTHVCLTV
jgi:hypothetical protein